MVRKRNADRKICFPIKNLLFKLDIEAIFAVRFKEPGNVCFFLRIAFL